MDNQIYPPRNSVIVFREPFPCKEYYDGRVRKYHIKATVDDLPEQEIRIAAHQQRHIMDQLVEEDGKLTNAVVWNSSIGEFHIVEHSPQLDFFSLVE